LLNYKKFKEVLEIVEMAPPKKTEKMESDMEEIRKSLSHMSGELVKVTEQLTKLTQVVEEVKQLKDMISAKDKIINELERRLDNIEQQTRMEDVIITGLTIKPRSYAKAVASGSNVSEHAEKADLQTLERQVLQFLTEKDIHVDPKTISACHTLPRKDKTRPAIVLRFINRKNKTEMLSQGKKLRGTAVYLNEHLTQKTANIAREARSMRKIGKIKATWTRNCST
jgi:predicted nuclease with TOPRIM domain